MEINSVACDEYECKIMNNSSKLRNIIESHQKLKNLNNLLEGYSKPMKEILNEEKLSNYHVMANHKTLENIRNNYNNFESVKNETVFIDDKSELKCQLLVSNKISSKTSDIKRSKPKFTCVWPQCKYETNYKCNINKHKLIHFDVKKYKCDYNQCFKKYKTSVELKRHRKIHSGIKDFICDWNHCGKKFTESSSLRRHIKTFHSEENKLKCNYHKCNQFFERKSQLKAHRLMHLSKNKFVCDVSECGQTFSRNDSLSRHKRTIHMTKKLYKCSFKGCHQKFNRKDVRDIHIRNHKN
jgi:uncharacterized Zn-finger protein